MWPFWGSLPRASDRCTLPEHSLVPYCNLCLFGSGANSLTDWKVAGSGDGVYTILLLPRLLIVCRAELVPGWHSGWPVVQWWPQTCSLTQPFLPTPTSNTPAMPTNYGKRELWNKLFYGVIFGAMCPDPKCLSRRAQFGNYGWEKEPIFCTDDPNDL